MQNRIKTKRPDESRKMTCEKRGKKYHFQKGWENKNRFSDRNIDPWSPYPDQAYPKLLFR
jgi:hypothetical protein